MSAITPDKLTTADINAALRLKYTQPEWALMFEVAATTGWAGRYADAVAMNMYPSRGLAVHGFEVKVSRSDWQRELKNPAKAEVIARYCDQWWIVTPPGIVQDGELPLTWGLMELRGSALKVVTKAPNRQDVTPLDRNFLAAMLRRAHQVDEATVAKLVSAGLEERTHSLRREHEGEMRRLKDEVKRTRELMAEVREKTGIEMLHYLSSDQLAGYLRVAATLELHGGDYGPLRNMLRELRHTHRKSGQLADALGEAIEGLLRETAPDPGGRP